MKLGFFTAALPERPLTEIAEWAATHGYQALEVAAWPAVGGRPHTAAHVDVHRLDAAYVDDVRALFEKHQLTLSSLGYYENNLHPDPDRRRAINEHVLRCIDAAGLLGCPTVGTFIGRDLTKTVKENRPLAEETFTRIVDRAGERGVTVVIENCPMHGWHDDGYPGNLAYSPELWDWIVGLGLHLNFDPSHLVWLGIDHVDAARRYVDHIAHAQAKDAEVLPSERNRYSVFGPTLERDDPWDARWWRYRLPGLGAVDWAGLVDALRDGGYDGTVSVEHEDPEAEGDPGRVQAGLELAGRTLRPLVAG